MPWSYIYFSPKFIAVFYPFIIGILSLLLLGLSRLRIKNAEAEIQEINFEIYLHYFKKELGRGERRAEMLIRNNQGQLRRYYELSLCQNLWVFIVGVFCIMLGVAILGVATCLIYKSTSMGLDVKIVIAAIGTLGSLFTNIVGAVYLKMHSGATSALISFHSKLVDTHQSLLGNLIASRIDDSGKRWDALSQVATKIAEKSK